VGTESLITNNITYRWYRTNAAGTDRGFTGVTTQSFAISSNLSAGTHYFLVELAVEGATGFGQTSSVATITVSAPYGYHAVTFHWNDGNPGDPTHSTVLVHTGGTVTAPILHRVDYIFTEWTTDANGNYAFDFDTEIDADTTLYAQWDARIPHFYDVGFFWATGHIHYAVNHGFMAGTAPGYFSPNMPFSRAMFVAMLFNAEGAPTEPLYRTWDELADVFTDINIDAWYGRAVLWAYDAGIVGGVGGGRFDSGGPISRAMMATLMRNYAQAKGWYAENPITDGADPLAIFPDRGDIPNWAEGAMAWAVYNNLIAGMDGRANPMAGAPRSQAAAIMRNFTVNIITTCDRGTAEQWRYDNIISVGFVPRAVGATQFYRSIYESPSSVFANKDEILDGFVGGKSLDYFAYRDYLYVVHRAKVAE